MEETTLPGLYPKQSMGPNCTDVDQYERTMHIPSPTLDTLAVVFREIEMANLTATAIPAEI